MPWTNSIAQYGQFKLGDIVTGYYAGYYRIRSIDQSEYIHPETKLPTVNTVVSLTLVSDSKGVRPKKEGKPKVCSITYCHPVTRERIEKEYQETVAAALKLRDARLAVVR